MSNRRRDQKEPDAVRIATQYQSRHAKVYELEAGGVVLDLHISLVDDSNGGGYCVEARNNHGPDAIVVRGQGATRAEAFDAARLSWEQDASRLGLPRFDWEAVRAALNAVRAL